MQWSGERPGTRGRSVCGPSWAEAIQGKSRKEEMMASPNPASALSCPTPDNSEKGTSLPQGQSWHPGSEALPDNFLYGAFPSLQGLHLPLLHWPLPSRMCSWFLLRERERTEEGEKNLFERLFLSKLSPFFNSPSLANVLDRNHLHLLFPLSQLRWRLSSQQSGFSPTSTNSSSVETASAKVVNNLPAETTTSTRSWVLILLGILTLRTSSQAFFLPLGLLPLHLYVSSPSQVQPWTRVLFCLPPVMMNISPLCHRHWPPSWTQHLTSPPSPAQPGELPIWYSGPGKTPFSVSCLGQKAMEGACHLPLSHPPPQIIVQTCPWHLRSLTFHPLPSTPNTMILAWIPGSPHPTRPPSASLQPFLQTADRIDFVEHTFVHLTLLLTSLSSLLLLSGLSLNSTRVFKPFTGGMSSPVATFLSQTTAWLHCSYSLASGLALHASPHSQPGC